MGGNRLAYGLDPLPFIQLDHRHPGGFSSRRLGEDPPLQPRTERGHHQRDREQQHSDRHSELDGGVATVGQGSCSIAA